MTVFAYGSSFMWRRCRSALVALGLMLAACHGGAADNAPAAGAAPITSAAELPAYQRITPKEIESEASYTHRWSGMVLPPQVGDLRRVRLVEFDAEATDVSGVYQGEVLEGPVLINTYIYAMGGLATVEDCQAEFDAVKQNIRDRFPNAAVVKDERETAPGFGAGLVAVYDATGDVLGPTMPIRTEAHLYCGVEGLWLVKYRITYPRDADIATTIADFIAASPIRAAP